MSITKTKQAIIARWSMLMPKPLTAKQEQFCLEYLIDLNATQAAIRAGYSAKTANVIGPENLSKPCIAERIAKAQADRTERTTIDADFVLNGLKELNQICMGQKEVTYTVDGIQESMRVFEQGGAARSFELIGKHLGMFVERKEITGEVSFMSTLLDEISENDGLPSPNEG